MRTLDWLTNVPSLADLRRELRELYDDSVQVFSGKHHARFLPDDVPIHVISRVFQGRFLLTPGPQLNRLIAGVIGRAQEVFPDVQLYATVFMSNHLHMMLKGPAEQTAAFIGYVKREVSRRWGGRPEVSWPGTMWDEYIGTALPTDESQVLCLKYILSHGVKEGLVAKPQLWPGVHSASQLLTGSTLKGEWLDSTNWTRARDAERRKQKPRHVRKSDYYRSYGVRFSPIPAWSALEAGEQRQRVRVLVDEIVEEGRIARKGRKPLGAKAVMKISRERRSKLPAQPWFEDRHHMICWADPRSEETQAYLSRYWAFQRAFRSASAAFRAGSLDVGFPPGAFRPVTHQATAAGPP